MNDPQDKPRPSQDTSLIEDFLELSIEERFAENERAAAMLVELMLAAGSKDDRLPE